MFDSDAQKTVYLVRHGQSEDNIAPIYQSPLSELSEAGRQQAEHLAERCAKIDFEVLMSSPLTRARRTAEAISRTTGKTPVFSDLLVEAITPEGVRGKPYEDPEALALWKQWQESLSGTGPKVGIGESFVEMIARADAALGIFMDRPEKTLLAVTHGYFMRAIIARILLADSLTADNFIHIQTRASMQNTGISVIQYTDKPNGPSWKLWTYNDHAHLG